jgi:hypothetical protein
MIKIYAAENLQAACLLQGLLAENGIEAEVLNQYAQGGLGELPFTHTYPEIWLSEAGDLDRAREIIADFEKHGAGQSSLSCPHCGEECPDTFELCWHCKAPLKPSR